ncbi:hypothetical protein E2C01_029565 [Portunus trituberculatus]|uniref:Uncharacterized protein n=1 Tax=Portunus trituberculatus TaxID=210409 RepID=A0A5B7ES72_PORTR|nr:hypothetical protein [Portunus trituberculatus]
MPPGPGVDFQLSHPWPPLLLPARIANDSYPPRTTCPTSFFSVGSPRCSTSPRLHVVGRSRSTYCNSLPLCFVFSLNLKSADLLTDSSQTLTPEKRPPALGA